MSKAPSNMATCPVCQAQVKAIESTLARHHNWRTGRQCTGSNLELTTEAKEQQPESLQQHPTIEKGNDR